MFILVTLTSNTEWISVKDRLPECGDGAESELVLYRMKTTGTIEVGYYGRGGKQRDSYFRHLRDASEGVDSGDVSHWMPLPEPSKEQGESQCQEY